MVVILVRSCIHIQWDISFSFLGVLSFAETVTSEPQMWFTWNVLPAGSLLVKATTEARACWIWMKAWADLLSCSGSALSSAIVWRRGWGWVRLLYAFWRGWFQTILINGAYWQFLFHLFTQAFLFDFNLTSVLHSANQIPTMSILTWSSLLLVISYSWNVTRIPWTCALPGPEWTRRIVMCVVTR